MNSEIPLPPTAQDIAEIIGEESALAIAFTTRHRCVYVPTDKPNKRLPSHSYLVRTIGEEKAKLLQRHFGGMLLPMATCHHTKQALIRAKIQQLKTQQHANA
jgi:hypothetical protein